MAALLRNRVSLVWLGLVLATILSFEMPGVSAAEGHRMAGAVVLAIAFVKTRYIMLEFMELRHASLALRLVAELWALAVCLAVIAFYWTGSG